MPTPTLYTELPENTWTLADWKEVMAENKPAGSGIWSLRDQQDAITIELPANKLRSCIKEVFGYSIADPDGLVSPSKLIRKVPIQHPTFPWLWANAASSTLTSPFAGYEHQDAYDNPTAKMTDIANYNAPPVSGEYGLIGRYAKCYLTISFKPFFGRIYKDDDVFWTGNEVDRFVGMKTMTPKLELINAAGADVNSAFRFADTVTGGPTTGPDGTLFVGSVYSRKQTATYAIEWFNVEESYLVDTSADNYFLMPYPVRVLNAMGTLNELEFCGHAPGTLLFQGCQAVRYPQPIATDDQENLWAWDFLLMFNQFDPQDPPRPGVVVTEPIGRDPKRGHLLFPTRQSLGWYYATRSTDPTYVGTYNGEGILPLTDFNDIFEYWNTP